MSTLVAVLWLLLCAVIAVAWAGLRGWSRLRLPQPKGRRPVIELAMHNWLAQWMVSRNWGGFTCPLPFVTVIFYWLMPGESVDPLIRVHEFVHARQADELGWACDWVSYEREAVRGSYETNKFEREAYAVEAAAAKNGLPDWAKPHTP